MTIGDRTVGGLISRDPLVGPWQVPVSDVAVTLLGPARRDRRGDVDRRATRHRAARRAGVRSHRGRRGDHQHRRRRRAAHRRRQAVGQLDGGLRRPRPRTPTCSTPCGRSARNSARRSASPFRSARIRCRCARTGATAATERSVVAPLSLVVSAFAPVADVRRTLTPVLATSAGPTVLLLVDLGGGRDRLGGSCLAQVHGAIGDVPPDLDAPAAPDRLLRGHPRARRRRGHPGLPRPLRRRARDHAARDGVRRARRARHRPRRRRTAGGRALQRGTRRRAAVARAGPRAGAGRARAPRARRLLARDRDDGGRPPDPRHGRREAAARRRPRAAARPLVRDQLAHAALARRPGLRGRGTGRAPRPGRPGPQLAAHVRSRRRRRARTDRDRRAAARGDPARAGRQQPGRDGGGVRPRRFRGDRRAHDRPDRRRRDARGIPGPGRLRRLQLWRRARRRRGLGQVDPVQPARARAVRGLVRAGRSLHARGLQRLPDAGRARGADPGRRLLAAIPAQPLGAVRGPPGAGRDRRIAFAVLHRHGRQSAADCGRARRGAGRVPQRRRTKQRPRP